MMELDVLFEDNHLLVVNKPAGILTQPSGTDQDSIEAIAKDYLKKKYNKPGNVYLHAVHRLDKPASGIVLFAKTSKALSRLNEKIRSKDCEKIYTALIEGNLIPSEGVLEHYLLHDEHHTKVVSANTPGAKKAFLKYKTLSNSLLEIELETGRYHQIRAQLAAQGCPIVGDTKYGSTQKLPHQAIALHHTRLMIPHPISGESVTFTSPPSFA